MLCDLISCSFSHRGLFLMSCYVSLWFFLAGVFLQVFQSGRTFYPGWFSMVSAQVGLYVGNPGTIHQPFMTFLAVGELRGPKSARIDS